VSRGRAIGWAAGAAGFLAVNAFILVLLVRNFSSVTGAQGGAVRESFSVRLDAPGPYLIVSTEGASRIYTNALAQARKLHPDALETVFPVNDFSGVRQVLQQQRPRYALVFILPEELDVNFAWRWLTLTTELDADPFVDVRTGFITGKNAGAADKFMARIAAAVEGQFSLPAVMVDNFGPNAAAPAGAFNTRPNNSFLPALARRCQLRSISHGTQGFTKERLDSMEAAGFVHFGGHGSPDRIVEGLLGAWVPQLKLAPCIVFNGACYTGVTRRWFELGPAVEERSVAEDSFCLNLLANNVIGYFAALHFDHGMPVYQEIEQMAVSGQTLGDIIKHTHDGVILASGGKLPAFEVLSDGMPAPKWSPSELMRKGTASRILFGDPALIVAGAFTAPPFTITVSAQSESILRITAVLNNDRLQATFTDTYHDDLAAQKNMFNDRALIVCELPADWKEVANLEVTKAEAGGKSIPHRLVGFGVEHDENKHRLCAQVDLAARGFMKSDFRRAGATVVLVARKKAAQ
jgi:hypothetical protein